MPLLPYSGRRQGKKCLQDGILRASPQIPLDLELLVLPLIEVTGRRGMIFAKRFNHFPPPTHPNPPQSTPPHPVYRRGEDEGGAAKGSAGYLGLSHANNISPTNFFLFQYFSYISIIIDEQKSRGSRA